MKDWIEPILPNVDVLFASPHDLRDILGLGDDPVDAAEKALANFDLEYVVIPYRVGRVGGVGTNSIRIVGDGVDAYSECEGRIVDPIGAGDTGAGVLIASLEQGLEPQSAADYAARASAWVQTHAGDSAKFRRDEIINADRRRVRR
jgi:sugar/nucleoside kinase (ribokinase family)